MSTEQQLRVLDEKRHVSSKISDSCRYVGFGLVAVVYAIITSDSRKAAELYSPYTGALLVSAALGGFTVVLDYIQFLAGYFVIDKALGNEAGGFRYDNKSWLYWLRSGAFFCKQITALAGALLFCYTILAPIK